MTQAIRPAATLDVYSHGIKVTGFDEYGKTVLDKYCAVRLGQTGLVPVGRGKFIKQIVRVYATATQDRREYRFHRNLLDDLISAFDHAGIGKSQLDIIEHALYEPTAVTFNYSSPHTPRDYQEIQIDYMVSPGTMKSTTLATGYGKTFISIKATSMIGQRTAIVVRPMYIQRWIDDVVPTLNLRKGELLVVQGSKDLTNLIALAQTKQLDAKVIIISNKTMMNYYKAYATFKSENPYGVNPENFYHLLGIGLRIIDEVHQDFHLNLKQECYTHVPKVINLSATLDSDDKFMNRMYEIMMPTALRAPTVEQKPYIIVNNVFYTINPKDLHQLRYLNSRKQYSHILFEQSLRKKKWVFEKYLEMIGDLSDSIYMEEREPGQKYVIYCGSVDVCTLVRDYLRNRYKDKGLEINRYTEKEPYELLLSSDIAVTTLQSAGTAVDVPNLKSILCTIALSSKQANIQLVGRLRPLKDWPETHPQFYFLFAEGIAKHAEYAWAKQNKLDAKVLSFRTMHAPHHL